MVDFEKSDVIRKRRRFNMILTIILCYAIFLAFMFVNQRSFIYFPDKNRYHPAQAGLPEAEMIAVRSEGLDQAIEGWYVPPSVEGMPVILYFHGNAGNQAIRVPRARHYIEQGYGVLLAGYRGYGGNPGRPAEKGFFADGLAYFDWLEDQAGIPEERIVIYGESLGTGVAVWLATRKLNIRALVLEAPYSSLVDIARARFFFIPVDLLMRDRYTSAKRISGVTAPVLFLHGQRDMVVPPRYGQRLYDAANQPKTMRLFPDAGHNDLYAHGAADSVLAFLSGLN